MRQAPTSCQFLTFTALNVGSGASSFNGSAALFTQGLRVRNGLSVAGCTPPLAMVAGGRAREGATLYVPMPAGEIPVTVTRPVFYDPEGTRLHG